MLEWISQWYSNNCNGNWEHDYKILIETLDNPGWSITIDTEGTEVELKDKTWQYVEKDHLDWYGYKISNGIFEASGDPEKLKFLLELFRESIIESKKIR